MATGLDDSQLINIGKDFWGSLQDVLDDVVAENITNSDGLGGFGRIPSVVPMGTTRVNDGLEGLLRCPNLLPAPSLQTRAVTQAMVQFDLSPCTVQESHNNWLYQKQTVICYWFEIHDHMPDPRIVGDVNLGGKNKVLEHFKDAKNKLAAVLIARCAFGWNLHGKGVDNFRRMAGKLTYAKQYYLFVLPMVYFLVTEMNPGNHLNAKTILTQNLPRVMQEYIHKRIKAHGIWSQQLMLRRLALPLGHEWGPQGLHKDITKGYEFHFARLASLILRDLKRPYDDENEHTDWEKLNITQEELQLLWVGYNHVAKSRYGPPIQNP